MATWPSSLPNPSYSGYQFQIEPMLVRTEMDAGEPKQRLRYRKTIDTFPVSWQFTSTQLETFETFIRDEANQGASWFDLPLADGQGIRMMEGRLIEGKYSVAPLTSSVNFWQVTAQLEVRNRR